MNIALVTGASRGIGKAFVKLLSGKGYFVYAGVRNLTGCTDTKSVHYILLDITSDESITQAIEYIKRRHGVINLLINNAGINQVIIGNGQFNKVENLNEVERWMLQEMLDVNSISPMIVIKHSLPLMTDPNSFIINVSSDRGSHSDRTSPTGKYGYRSSKAALNMLTCCLVMDLPANVSVFAVHPGWVKTDMNLVRGYLSPGESATSIIQILDKWRPEMNGRFLRRDGTPHPL